MVLNWRRRGPGKGGKLTCRPATVATCYFGKSRSSPGTGSFSPVFNPVESRDNSSHNQRRNSSLSRYHLPDEPELAIADLLHLPVPELRCRWPDACGTAMLSIVYQAAWTAL
jgi:hypothetical protein